MVQDNDGNTDFCLVQELLKGKEFVMVIEINNQLYVTYLKIYGIIVSGGHVSLDDYPGTGDMGEVELCAVSRVITQAAVDAGTNNEYRVGIRSPSDLREIITSLIDDLESPAEQGEDPFDEENPHAEEPLE